MNAGSSMLYRISRWLLRVALGFYFSRIERFHLERVPRTGPLLFTSNHPNSVADAFVIGTSVPRKVNFVATVQLFRLAPLRWLLTHIGVVPINRVKDDPRQMRTVMDTFAACFRVLEQGEAVGIFPEGITHDDPQLKTVKTGAARMALELEHRHAGTLGLQIVPVGLTFSAKHRYRSEGLVHFGEPIQVADYLAGYPEKKHDCIHRLTAEIEHRMTMLILHLPRLERARVVAAVKRLYLDHLRVDNRVIHEPVPRQTGELLLTQAIASAVDYTYDHHPEHASVFASKLDRYERWLKRLNLTDEELAHFPDKTQRIRQSVGWTVLGVVLLPVAVYGWLHRLLPIAWVNRAVARASRLRPDHTQVATTAILFGAMSFGVVYGAYVAMVQAVFGFPVSLWYALSLPAASLVAHYYFRNLLRIAVGMRSLRVLLRAPSAARRLLAWRAELIAEIESARWQVPNDVLIHEVRGAA